MSSAIRVLLCDDHKIVREGLKMVLADDALVHVVAEADTGLAVLDTLQTLQGPKGIDVVLLDIALPGIDGLDVLQALRRDWPGLPVLMLSTYPEKQYAVRCIQLGASGYLNKSTNPDVLIAALHRVATGGMHISPTTAEALASLVSQGRTKTGIDKLSHREHQVYLLLTQGHSVSEIGAQLSLAPNTVSTYRARILEKTGAKNDVELALYAQSQRTDKSQLNH
jgi:two-component system, NarL family, invasion response regulator UvrY